MPINTLVYLVNKSNIAFLRFSEWNNNCLIFCDYIFPIFSFSSIPQCYELICKHGKTLVMGHSFCEYQQTEGEKKGPLSILESWLFVAIIRSYC